jgi:general L-amino acid transport system substrate-binding protein
MKSSNVPEILRLVGVEGAYGEMLELSNDFAYNIISQVGNYSESYERNVGPDTPLAIGRGNNALWNQGGILYAPPFR